MDNLARLPDRGALRRQALECLDSLSLSNVERALRLLQELQESETPTESPEDLARQARQLLKLDQPLASAQAGECLQALRIKLLEHQRASRQNILTDEALTLRFHPVEGTIFCSAGDRVVYGKGESLAAARFHPDSGTFDETPLLLEKSAPPAEPGPLALSQEGARHALTHALNFIGKLKREASDPAPEIAAISPDGAYVAAAHTVHDEHGFPTRLLEVFRRGGRIASFTLPAGLKQLVFVPGQDRLIAAVENSKALGLGPLFVELQVYNFSRCDERGQTLLEYRCRAAQDAGILELAVSPDGTQIAMLLAERDGLQAAPRVRLAGLPLGCGHGQEINLLGAPPLYSGAMRHLLQTRGLQFSPDGKSLYLSGPGREVLEIAAGKGGRYGEIALFAKLPFDESPVFSSAVSPDGTQLAAWNDKGEAGLYAIESRGRLRRLGKVRLEGGIVGARFDASGGQLIIQGKDELRVYRLG